MNNSKDILTSTSSISGSGSFKKKQHELIVLDEFQFSTKDELGEGGFGRVFKGYNTKTFQFVAIKQLRIANHKSQHLQREINLLKKLKHEHIVQYLGHKQSAGFLYIIMEYLESGSLGSFVRRYQGKVSESMVAHYVAQVLKGLSYLHGQGIIHRDIKGDNVLLTKTSAVKLADFGVAQNLSQIRPKELAGTPYWMAPEIISFNGATYQSDVWSVGCMVIEMLTGRPPYYNLNHNTAFYRIVNDDHPPLPVGCSAAIKDFLMLCFKKEPSLRKGSDELLRHPWIVQALGGSVPSSLKSVKSSPLHPISPKTNSDQSLVSSPKSPSSIQRFDTVIRVKATSPSPLIQQQVKTDEFKDKSDSSSSSEFYSTDEDDDDDDDDSNNVTYATVIRRKNNSRPSIDVNNLYNNTPVSNVKTDISPSSLSISKKKQKKLEKYVDDDEDDWFDDADDDNDSFHFHIPSISNSEISEDLESLFDDVDADVKYNELDKQERGIGEVIDLLVPQTNEEKIVETCQNLLEQLDDEKTKPIILNCIAHKGTMSIIELLMNFENVSVLLAVMKLLNKLIEGDKTLQESLCMLGIFPKILRLANDQYPKLVRYEACYFIYKMCNSSKFAVQMFIAGDGLFALAKYLATERGCNADQMVKEMMIKTIDIIRRILSITMEQRTDFCRLLAAAEVYTPLSQLMSLLLENAQDRAYVDHVLEIFLQSSVTGSIVRSHLASDKVIQILPKLKALLFIKNLSSDHNVQQLLKKNGVLPVLIGELSNLLSCETITDPLSLEGRSYLQIINALSMLCLYDVEARDIIIQEGSILLLKEIIVRNLALQDMAISLMLAFTVGSVYAIDQMIKDGIPCLLHIVEEKSNGAALTAISDLLSTHFKEVEPILLQDANLHRLTKALSSTSRSVFALMPPLVTILSISKNIASKLAKKTEFITVVASVLTGMLHPERSSDHDPIHLRNPLIILDILFQYNSTREFLETGDVYSAVEKVVTLTEKKNLQILQDLTMSLLKKFNTVRKMKR